MSSGESSSQRWELCVQYFCYPKFLGTVNGILTTEQKNCIEGTPFGWTRDLKLAFVDLKEKFNEEGSKVQLKVVEHSLKVKQCVKLVLKFQNHFVKKVYVQSGKAKAKAKIAICMTAWRQTPEREKIVQYLNHLLLYIIGKEDVILATHRWMFSWLTLYFVYLIHLNLSIFHTSIII